MPDQIIMVLRLPLCSPLWLVPTVEKEIRKYCTLHWVLAGDPFHLSSIPLTGRLNFTLNKNSRTIYLTFPSLIYCNLTIKWSIFSRDDYPQSINQSINRIKQYTWGSIALSCYPPPHPNIRYMVFLKKEPLSPWDGSVKCWQLRM